MITMPKNSERQPQSCLSIFSEGKYMQRIPWNEPDLDPPDLKPMPVCPLCGEECEEVCWIRRQQMRTISSASAGRSTAAQKGRACSATSCPPCLKGGCQRQLIGGILMKTLCVPVMTEHTTILQPTAIPGRGTMN